MGLLGHTDGLVDSVMSFNVFEHIDDDETAFRTVFEVLTPGGPSASCPPARCSMAGWTMISGIAGAMCVWSSQPRRGRLVSRSNRSATSTCLASSRGASTPESYGPAASLVDLARCEFTTARWFAPPAGWRGTGHHPSDSPPCWWRAGPWSDLPGGRPGRRHTAPDVSSTFDPLLKPMRVRCRGSSELASERDPCAMVCEWATNASSWSVRQ